MLEKFHLRVGAGEGGGIKILGTQWWEKLGGEGFFFLQAREELTLDDTMIWWQEQEIS